MNDRARLTGRMSRVPLRVRLVTGFVIAMTVLLCAAGGFVYWRVKVDLDTALDRDLSEEFAAILPLVDSDGRVPDQPDAGNVRAHQTLSAAGEVLSSGAGAGTYSTTRSGFRFGVLILRPPSPKQRLPRRRGAWR